MSFARLGSQLFPGISSAPVAAPALGMPFAGAQQSPADSLVDSILQTYVSKERGGDARRFAEELHHFLQQLAAANGAYTSSNALSGDPWRASSVQDQQVKTLEANIQAMLSAEIHQGHSPMLSLMHLMGALEYLIGTNGRSPPAPFPPQDSLYAFVNDLSQRLERARQAQPIRGPFYY